RSALEGGAASSCSARQRAADGQDGRLTGGNPQACHSAYLAPFLCDAPAAEWLRHSYRSGTARPQGCEYDDDLHACAQPGRARRQESAGCVAPNKKPRRERRGFRIRFESEPTRVYHLARFPPPLLRGLSMATLT